jgi:hypothetical protein
MPWHAPHGIEDANVANASAYELLDDHPRSSVSEFVHMR